MEGNKADMTGKCNALPRASNQDVREYISSDEWLRWHFNWFMTAVCCIFISWVSGDANSWILILVRNKLDIRGVKSGLPYPAEYLRIHDCSGYDDWLSGLHGMFEIASIPCLCPLHGVYAYLRLLRLFLPGLIPLNSVMPLSSYPLLSCC